MRAVAAAALLATLLAGGAARASGGGDSLPFTVDPYGGNKADQDAYYDGNVGVLMQASPFSRLFAGWRMLHRLPVGREVGATLAVPCCDVRNDLAAATEAWLQARKQVPGAPELSYVAPYRQLPDFVGILTCFPDAFRTAARTLGERMAAHGATQPDAVRAWLAAQDVVFANCSGETPPPADPKLDLPALPADAPDWLVRDRAYQAAARHLYRREFADARTGFAAVAADPLSPWARIAPYLVARATLAAALPSADPAVLRGARGALEGLPPGGISPAEAAGWRHALDFRLDPDARRAALVSELTGPALPPNAAADFKDARRLGHPADNPFLDWLTVVGRPPDQPGAGAAGGLAHYDVENVFTTDGDAMAHARRRWEAMRDTAWLLAVLQAVQPGPDAAEAVAASRAIATDDPAYLTAAYHRVRLTLADAPDAARAELDAVLARPGLSVTTANLFQAARTMLSTSPADLAGRAVRQPPCRQSGASEAPWPCAASYYGIDGLPEEGTEARLGAEAAAIIDRMTVAQRIGLLDLGLPPGIRLDIALTTWTRAVLAGDHAAATKLVPALRELLPQLARDWSSYAAAPPGEEQRFAAWFVLAKLPGAAVDLAGEGGAYTRPTGTVAEFEGAWPDWSYARPGRPAAPVPAPAGPRDVVCFGLCGNGAFSLRLPQWVSAAGPTAAAERGRFAPADANAAGWVWEDVLAYARAHPADPRSPEALYWLVRVSRFGKSHARSGFRAFQLLHTRYRASDWTKRTPYFYD